jgi:Tfp pilus assembly protein PilO
MKKSKSSRSLLVLLLLVVVGAAAYMLVFRPQSAALADVADEQAGVDSALSVARADAADTADEEAAAAQAAADQAALDAAVPPTPELSNLLRQIDMVAARSGMTASSITPSPPVTATPGAASAVSISISTTGTRAGAYDFLRQLRDLPRVIVADQVNLQAPEAGATDQSFKLDVTVRAFTTEAVVAPAAG